MAAVLPVGAARLLSRLPFAAVHEVRAGDALDVGGVRVEAVPAWHDGRRLPGPGAREHDTLGFLIDGVWFAGDTDYNEEMEALRGRVELALLPIWGWGPSLGPGHLDPRRPRGSSRSWNPRSSSRSTGARTSRSASASATSTC